MMPFMHYTQSHIPIYIYRSALILKTVQPADQLCHRFFFFLFLFFFFPFFHFPSQYPHLFIHPSIQHSKSPFLFPPPPILAAILYACCMRNAYRASSLGLTSGGSRVPQSMVMGFFFLRSRRIAESMILYVSGSGRLRLGPCTSMDVCMFVCMYILIRLYLFSFSYQTLFRRIRIYRSIILYSTYPTLSQFTPHFFFFFFLFRKTLPGSWHSRRIFDCKYLSCLTSKMHQSLLRTHTFPLFLSLSLSLPLSTHNILFLTW